MEEPITEAAVIEGEKQIDRGKKNSSGKISTVIPGHDSRVR